MPLEEARTVVPVFPVASLPDDPEELKSIILELSSRVAALEEHVMLGRAKKYGISSEKSVDQHEMFNEAELSVVAEDVLTQQAVEREVQSNTLSDKPKKKAARKPLSDSLPRVHVEHTTPDADNICDCGCQRVEIGEETSEQLDILPAKIQVIVNVRKNMPASSVKQACLPHHYPRNPFQKAMPALVFWLMWLLPSIRMACHYIARKPC